MVELSKRGTRSSFSSSHLENSCSVCDTQSRTLCTQSVICHDDEWPRGRCSTSRLMIDARTLRLPRERAGGSENITMGNREETRGRGSGRLMRTEESTEANARREGFLFACSFLGVPSEYPWESPSESPSESVGCFTLLVSNSCSIQSSEAENCRNKSCVRSSHLPRLKPARRTPVLPDSSGGLLRTGSPKGNSAGETHKERV